MTVDLSVESAKSRPKERKADLPVALKSACGGTSGHGDALGEWLDKASNQPPKSAICFFRTVLYVPLLVFWGKFFWTFGVVWGKPIAAMRRGSDGRIKSTRSTCCFTIISCRMQRRKSAFNRTNTSNEAIKDMRRLQLA